MIINILYGQVKPPLWVSPTRFSTWMPGQLLSNPWIFCSSSAFSFKAKVCLAPESFNGKTEHSLGKSEKIIYEGLQISDFHCQD
jgi:hypothetical protein